MSPFHILEHRKLRSAMLQSFVDYLEMKIKRNRDFIKLHNQAIFRDYLQIKKLKKEIRIIKDLNGTI